MGLKTTHPGWLFNRTFRFRFQILRLHLYFHLRWRPQKVFMCIELLHFLFTRLCFLCSERVPCLGILLVCLILGAALWLHSCTDVSRFYYSRRKMSMFEGFFLFFSKAMLRAMSRTHAKKLFCFSSRLLLTHSGFDTGEPVQNWSIKLGVEYEKDIK